MLRDAGFGPVEVRATAGHRSALIARKDDQGGARDVSSPAAPATG